MQPSISIHKALAIVKRFPGQEPIRDKRNRRLENTFLALSSCSLSFSIEHLFVSACKEK